MIVLDTSGLLAAIHDRQARHREARQALISLPGPRLLSPFVLAELDYLLTERASLRLRDRLLAEVERGVYRLEPFLSAALARARAVSLRYADLDLGLTDASLVVLAERHRTRDILTLDQRHFRAVTDVAGRPFRVLPSDL